MIGNAFYLSRRGSEMKQASKVLPLLLFDLAVEGTRTARGGDASYSHSGPTRMLRKLCRVATCGALRLSRLLADTPGNWGMMITRRRTAAYTIIQEARYYTRRIGMVGKLLREVTGAALKKASHREEGAQSSLHWP